MAKPTAPTASKLVWKGSQEFRHDLFKLHPSKCKRNLSYTKGSPQIEEVTHTHHFHSVDRSGKPCIVASMACGHTHKVEVSMTADGSLKAVCGPAIKEVTKKIGKDRVKKEMVSVEWQNDESEEGILVDEHTHDITYQWSEVISPNQIKAQQQQDAKRLGDLMGMAPPKPGPQLLEQGD